MPQNHIDPNQMPRRTWNTQQDVTALWNYLYMLTGDLKYRLEEAERKIRKLENKQKKE